MNTPLDTIEYKGCAIKVYPDVDVENPRNDDNFGTMVCFHKRHLLGDENHGYTSNDYHGWDELEAAIQKEEGKLIVLPLYLYDHSGITMRTTPFDCRWDSGQVGLYFVSKKKAREEFGKLTAKTMRRVKAVLEVEVEVYDQWLTGEGYYLVAEDAEGNRLDSVCGILGDDGRDDVIFEMKITIDNYVKNSAVAAAI